MGQAEAKLADSEMCCGGKRSRDRNNRLGHNPRQSQSEGSSIFNFGIMNDEDQENDPNWFSTKPQSFIQPTPREQGPRRGVVAMKAPKFTVVAESEPPHPEPNQTLLNEIVNHSRTGAATPLGVRANQQQNYMPVQKPNWTPPVSNGAQGRNNLSSEYARSFNGSSSNASFERERMSASSEGNTDSVNMSRTSTGSAEIRGLYSASNRFSWHGSAMTASQGSSRTFSSTCDSPDSRPARTVSISPFASVAPANPLATRGQLPEGALPRLKTPKGPMSTGRADFPLPQPIEAASAGTDTTESFIAEVKSLIDKSREQLKKAEFRRSRKQMVAQDEPAVAGQPQARSEQDSYVAFQ